MKRYMTLTSTILIAILIVMTIAIHYSYIGTPLITIYGKLGLLMLLVVSASVGWLIGDAINTWE